ncbi:MAG: septum site-determining protein MinC [Candidatus Sericytochromatia bacterium]
MSIKGVRQGILLVVPDDQEWGAVREQLKEKLEAASTLITGARAQLDLGDRAVTASELEALVGELKRGHQLELSGVMGTHEETRTAAEAVGLLVAAPVAAPADASAGDDGSTAPAEKTRIVPVPTDPSTFHNNALYMRQTIRSGQSVRHDGTIVICGDVNAGAEVIATGDIIVFGTLRGVAHAGATGDEESQIIAINLRPTQIRIAGYIARSPDAAAPPLSKFPEVARVQNSEIHIIPLRDMNQI